MRVDAFGADHRDHQPEDAGDVALERMRPAGELAGDHDAEHREPEELERAET